MDCPKCGYERQPEDTHCQLCGVDFGLLERQAEEKRALKEREKKKQAAEEEIQLSMEDKEPDVGTSPDPGSSTDAFMAEDCPKCGYERKKGDVECANCGLIYAKHEEMIAKKEAEKDAQKKAEQNKFAEEKARVQKELDKRVAEAQAKRDEESRKAKEAEEQKQAEKVQNRKRM